ncbi:CG2811, partial [Drosophila busckii]
SASLSHQLKRVFVYGTLKRNEPNHHWLTNKENGVSRFVAKGSTLIKFPLVIGTRYNIPFLLNKPGVGHHIEGEIYDVDELMFSKLDELEEYPNYYDREQQTIVTEQNNQFQCWLYLIRKYPERLLEKPLLSSYHNTEEQAYSERSVRDPSLPAKADLNY